MLGQFEKRGGDKRKMIGRGRSLGAGKTGISLRCKGHCPACDKWLGAGARRAQCPGPARASDAEQVFKQPCALQQP